MLRYRMFRDHAGRWHRVRKTDEEVLDAWRKGCGMAATVLAFTVVMVLASGIFG